MSHYSARSVRLTKDEFNYLLPVGKRHLLENNGKHYLVIESCGELEDFLDRLQGVYNCFYELPSLMAYECHKNASLEKFRQFIQSKYTT